MNDQQTFKLGLLAELHYTGDYDEKTRLRQSIKLLNDECADMLVLLGDIVDAADEAGSVKRLREIKELAEPFDGPVFYLAGNHDLDHLSKEQFYEALGQSNQSPACVIEQGGVTFVRLDANFTKANVEYNHGNFKWPDSAIPLEQIDWLENVLSKTDKPIVMLVHQCLDGEGVYTISNAADVREIIGKSGKVAAVFQGHRHEMITRVINETKYNTLPAFKNGASTSVVEISTDSGRILSRKQCSFS